MTSTTQKLEKFFEEIKALTIWKRVFGWSGFRSLSYEAYQEFKFLLSETERRADELNKTSRDCTLLKSSNDHLQERDRQQAVDLAASKERLSNLERESSRLKEENIIFRQTEEDRRIDYESKIANLNAINEKIQNDRQREIDGFQQSRLAALARQKDTWAAHEAKVREALKGICKKHTIVYVDKVPFKGTPDNAIRLCDEYIIFDAKSPGSDDDLGNFFNYLKTQTESAKKYIREESVKKEIYFVVPSNTVEVIERTAFNMADYDVYVVTVDALEPLILALKKLEDYEFVEQLSPDERDNICRVIGRFAHMTKRKIQIDQFFERHFLEILSRCEADLPSDILEKAVEYEKAEKLNPPQEKRLKAISSKSLQSDSQQIRKEAEAKNIAFPSSMQRQLADLPLHTEDESGPADE